MILPLPLNPRPNARVVNPVESQPTSGLYTKVSSKPTNHSKFTGKCGKQRCPDCRSHPVYKSMSKAKGAQKLKSCDVAKNHLLVSWRVADETKGMNRVSRYLDDEDEEFEDEAYGMRDSPGLTGIVIEDDNSDIDFCKVGFVLEQGGDEDWCII